MPYNMPLLACTRSAGLMLAMLQWCEPKQLRIHAVSALLQVPVHNSSRKHDVYLHLPSRFPAGSTLTTCTAQASTRGTTCTTWDHVSGPTCGRTSANYERRAPVVTREPPAPEDTCQVLRGAAAAAVAAAAATVAVVGACQAARGHSSGAAAIAAAEKQWAPYL